MGAGTDQHGTVRTADPPPRFTLRREERVVREPRHHSELLELLWWGSFWSVAGDSSARIVRESRRSWGFALIFPSSCLGKNNSCPWLFRSLGLGSSPANSRQPHRIPVLMKG